MPSVLFALNSYSIGHLPKLIIDEAYEKLQSNCQCDHPSIAKLLIYGTQLQYDFALNSLQNKGFSCLRSAMQSSAKEIESSYQNPNDNCKTISNENTFICRKTQEDQRTITRRIFLLIDKIMSNTHSINWNDFDLTKANPFNYSQLVDFIKSVEDHLLCRNYQSEEDRRIKVRSKDSLRSYIIKKELNGNYTVRIALEFSAAKGYDNAAVPKNQVHTYYINSIKNCIHNIDKFIGPNGERLNIIIENARENTSSCTPKYKISIHSTKYPSSIFDYKSDIDCPLATHEILHILGLVDEYKYRRKIHFIVLPDTNEIIDLPPNNCRVIQSQSIMAQEDDRWNLVFHILRNSRLAEESLLDPTHFNAILYGTCSQRNDVNLYRQCSQLAYLTSYDLNGNDLCPPLKQMCESQNILGR